MKNLESCKNWKKVLKFIETLKNDLILGSLAKDLIKNLGP